MKPDPNDELVDNVLAGDEVDAFRQASLAHGLSLMKARRQRRTTLRISAALLLPVCLALVIWKQRSAPAPRLTAVSSQTQSAPISKIHLINDDETVALLRDRPVAIIGPPGQQRLVFLDGSSPATE